jgi:hypothetical protein
MATSHTPLAAPNAGFANLLTDHPIHVSRDGPLIAAHQFFKRRLAAG